MLRFRGSTWKDNLDETIEKKNSVRNHVSGLVNRSHTLLTDWIVLRKSGLDRVKRVGNEWEEEERKITHDVPRALIH